MGNTAEGPVSGKTVSGVHAFMGIPYATPPVGELRWRPPRPALNRRQGLDASRPGPICPQTTPELQGKIVGEENCLNLNIWTTSLNPLARRPVMVHIHGGGFVVGFGAFPAINGRNFALDGAVLVTINYRLGNLGFLSHPALESRDPRISTGSFGQLDQMQALRWIQRNIANFGGDPSKVMIFGQSAGGYAICNLVASPLAVGLFSSAIVMSGGCLDRTTMTTQTEGSVVFPTSAQELGLALSEYVGCRRDDPKAERNCLLQKTSGEIADYMMRLYEDGKVGHTPGKISLLPSVDGTFLPDDTATLLAGKSKVSPSKVPLMFGIMAQDYRGPVLPGLEKEIGPLNDAEYLSYLTRTWGADFGKKLYDVYPLGDFGADARLAIANITFDHASGCVGREGLRLYDEVNGAANVYHYLYDIGEAAHGEEVPVIFGFGKDPKIAALGDSIRRSWIQFAATGIPGPVLRSPWNPSRTEQQTYLEFSDKEPGGKISATMKKGWIRGERCRVWEPRWSSQP